MPNAKLTYDAKTSRLVVFGTPAEHDLLKGALQKLIRPGGTGVGGSPQLEVYPLTRGDGAALLTTLQDVVPQAKLTLDAESKRLIAIAVPEDQRVIKRVLDQIESDEPVPNGCRAPLLSALGGAASDDGDAASDPRAESQDHAGAGRQAAQCGRLARRSRDGQGGG